MSYVYIVQALTSTSYCKHGIVGCVALPVAIDTHFPKSWLPKAQKEIPEAIMITNQKLLVELQCGWTKETSTVCPPFSRTKPFLLSRAASWMVLKLMFPPLLFWLITRSTSAVW